MTSQKISTPRTAPGFLALVSAGVLLLSGCAGGSPDADSSPTASQTASPTASPTPTSTPSAVYRPADASGPAQNVPVPVLPAVAKTETKEGAIAYSKYWFGVLNYAYETGNVALFDELAPSSCKTCQQVRKVILDWHSDGRWLVGGNVSTPAVSTTFQKDAKGRYQVAVQVRQTPISYMRADGTLARKDPQTADQGNLLLLAFDRGAWTVAELGRIVG